MGPKVLHVGPEVPEETLLWQDPLPAVDHELVDAADVATLKGQILDSGLTVAQLVKAAWASAASFRGSDKRGGANGARVRLAPQKDWAVNEPAELATVLDALTKIQEAFDAAQGGGKRVSLADLIVLGGSAAVEQAAKDGGYPLEVPFAPGRVDASQEQTDVESFDALEPASDGFRNYRADGSRLPAEYLLLDRANLLTLSAPEMTVLVGGLRVLGANHGERGHGHFTKRPGQLTNDFFVNLLDMDTVWEVVDATGDEEFIGYDRGGRQEKWKATRADLIFGSNSQLRATAEVYAERGHEEKFVRDFVKAWTKVMNADRCDLTYAKYHQKAA